MFLEQDLKDYKDFTLPIDETMICIVGGYSWGVVGNKEDYLVRITSIDNSADSVTCTVDDIEEYVRSIPMCTKNYGEMFDVMRITTFIRFCIEDYVQFSLKNIAKYLSDKETEAKNKIERGN